MKNNSLQEQENTLAGVVGALLFSLVGGVLWFVLYQIGYLAAVSGLIGVICAVKGYTFFAKTKNESVKCIIISVIATIIVLAASWYLCVAHDIYLAYKDWFANGEVDYTLTFFESVRAVPVFFKDSELLTGYLKDLAFGLGFAVVGVIYYLSLREKKLKRQKAAEAAAAASANQPTAEEVFSEEATAEETTEESSNEENTEA